MLYQVFYPLCRVTVLQEMIISGYISGETRSTAMNVATAALSQSVPQMKGQYLCTQTSL